MLRQLQPNAFSAPASEFAPGPVPMLQWIEIEKLVVDESYQRDIGKRGAMNVRQIAENFDWSKFAPVIAAPVEGGCFAIVDGQHRTTAALLRGLSQVPCQVVQADRAQQAAAYAAVNGNITRTAAHQIFHAKLAAGDPLARELFDACAIANVRVVRRNLSQAKMKVGETQCVGALTRCLQTYGRDTLVTALQCVTETADGNPGFLRATIIDGLCAALHERSDWREAGGTLLSVMDSFSFPDAWGEVAGDLEKVFPSTGRSAFRDKVLDHLSRHEMSLPTRAAA